MDSRFWLLPSIHYVAQHPAHVNLFKEGDVDWVDTARDEGSYLFQLISSITVVLCLSLLFILRSLCLSIFIDLLLFFLLFSFSIKLSFILY